MKFRPHHPQHIAAAKAGFSERTARRMGASRHLAAPPTAVRGRRVADPFDGLWDREIRPMLEAHPALRPVALLEEMRCVIPVTTGVGYVAALRIGFAPGAPNTAPIVR
jgi:hypothetical protein